MTQMVLDYKLQYLMIQKLKEDGNMIDLFSRIPIITSQYNTDNSRGSGDELHVVVADGTGDITGFDTDSDLEIEQKVLLKHLDLCLKTHLLNHHKVIVFTIQM